MKRPFDTFLAPMAGVNDFAFRLICKEQGAALTYSEMVSARGLASGNAATRELLFALPEEGPLAVQIFGHEPALMAEQAAWIAADFKRRGQALALIDINMGCPARKIIKHGDGAALLTHPGLAPDIVKACRQALPDTVPLTVKFRKFDKIRHFGFAPEAFMPRQVGEEEILNQVQDDLLSGTPYRVSPSSWEHSIGCPRVEESRADANAEARAAEATLHFAQDLEEAGVSAIALHGRSARQMYQGRADRELFGMVAQTLSIPVAASGDVFSTDDIADYLSRGAAAVMVARGARGNPWIFRGEPPTLEERFAACRRHLELLAAYQPQHLITLRRHFAWYFKGVRSASALRVGLNQCSSAADFGRVLDEYEEALTAGGQAAATQAGSAPTAGQTARPDPTSLEGVG
ncbi:MAG: tRNA-dihydrouridine synthase [Coriobacteriales bacterium]|nr:tRNA-dihydrouridine synthase [Coriobacteriales bacterium]